MAAYVIYQVLEFMAHRSWQGVKVSSSLIRPICFDASNDAHEESILVVDPREIGLRESLHCALCQFIREICMPKLTSLGPAGAMRKQHASWMHLHPGN